MLAIVFIRVFTQENTNSTDRHSDLKESKFQRPNKVDSNKARGFTGALDSVINGDLPPTGPAAHWGGSNRLCLEEGIAGRARNPAGVEWKTPGPRQTAGPGVERAV
ncbi:hypothetical protein, partial [Ralstonia pseudosolanacearum]|uniref:hypothetical protein n=1 Tax=Ralstonia pseudosolanacearum TaxID=1310165 RepID=UPI001FF8819D